MHLQVHVYFSQVDAYVRRAVPTHCRNSSYNTSHYDTVSYSAVIYHLYQHAIHIASCQAECLPVQAGEGNSSLGH